jgi:hypothetical protein
MADIPFKTSGDGRFVTIAHDQAGMPVEVAFLPDGRVVERRTMAEAWLEQLKRKAAAQRDVQRPGSLLGTQRHRLKTFEIPAPLAQSLTRRFGPYRKNGREWHKWLAAHAPHLLTSGYNL